MVFMTVGDNNAPYFFLSFHDITQVGNHQVDTEHFFFGKHESGVNDDDIVFILQHHHVLAYFTQSAERD